MSKNPPAVNFQTPNTPSGTEYGLSSDASQATFDLSGMPGLGSGSVKGSDLLHAFIAAGNGQGDPSIAAAIQQALALSGFYGNNSTFTPHPGRVLPEDIKAFAQALNVLADSNKATPQGDGALSQGLAQFLSKAAADGVASGQYGAQTKVHQYSVTTPNPQSLASTFEKVAQQVWDRKPTAAETAAFVRNFTSDSVGMQKANNQADYNAATQPVTVTGPGAPTPNPLAPATNPGTVTHPGGPGGPGASLGLGAADTTPPDFTDQMTSLQDVINANSQTTPSDTMVTSDQNALPDPGVGAEDYARNLHPGEAAANDFGNTMNNFLNLISTKLV